MANKSVIDIEINDSQVTKAFERFKKYRDNLQKLPKDWQKAGESASKAANNFDEAVTALNSAAAAMDNLVEYQKKSNKQQDELNRKLKTTEGGFQRMRGHMLSISQAVAGTTFNIMKWAGAMATVGATGGYFMMSGMASDVSDYRRRAQGLGISIGAMRAAELGFGKYGDIGNMMQQYAAAQTDIQKQWAFGAAGIPRGTSAAAAMPNIIEKAAQVWKAGPAELAGERLRVSGLSEIGVDTEFARRAAAMSPKERQEDFERVKRMQTEFDLQDKIAKKWQDLNITLGESKRKIETTLIEGLTKLTGPLGQLADAFSGAVKDLMDSPHVKEWISDLGVGIKNFAKYLKTTEFKEDVRDWMRMLDDLKDSMSGLLVVLEPFKLLAPTNVNKGMEAWMKGDTNEASRRLPASDFLSLQLRNMNPKLLGLNPELRRRLVASGLSEDITSGYRSKEKQQELWDESVRAGRPGRTKEGYPIARPGSSTHQAGEGVDVNPAAIKRRAEAENMSIADYLKKYDLYQPHKDDAPHLEMIKQRSDKQAAVSWNPTPIALNVQTTKIPGQDSNINLLTAGGYYTSLGVA